MDIETFALEAIEIKIKELPASKVIDRNVVLDVLLDLRQDLLRQADQSTPTPV